MEVKPPTTIEEQIEKLKKRGCAIKSEKKAKRFLREVNYYRVTGLLVPFKKRDNETYQDGLTMERIIRICAFDRKLRNLLLYALDFIEIELRAKIAYNFSHKYGSLGYLDEKNFYFRKPSLRDEHFKTIDKYKERNQRDVRIVHHETNYNGNIPLWVIIEFFFSQCSF